MPYPSLHDHSELMKKALKVAQKNNPSLDWENIIRTGDQISYLKGHIPDEWYDILKEEDEEIQRKQEEYLKKVIERTKKEYGWE